MRIQLTSQLITAGVILLTILGIACAVFLLRMRRLQQQANKSLHESPLADGQLLAGGSLPRIAMWACAAIRCRHHYEKCGRELSVDRTRDKTVEHVEKPGLAPEKLALLMQAKQNSDALVAPKGRFITAAEHSKLTEAVSLAYGTEYRKNRDSIMRPVTVSRRLRQTRLSGEADELATHATIAGAVFTGIFAVSAAANVRALLYFYSKCVMNPLVSLNGNLQDLVAHKPRPCAFQKTQALVERAIQEYSVV